MILCRISNTFRLVENETFSYCISVLVANHLNFIKDDYFAIVLGVIWLSMLFQEQKCRSDSFKILT